MDGGAITLLVMGLIATLILVGGGFIVFSRLAGSSQQSHPVPCWLRSTGESQWTAGEVRYDHTRAYFRACGMWGKRRHIWERSAFQLGLASRPEGDFPGGRISGLTQVTCSYGNQSFDLVLDSNRYTALRSWTESVPPGWNANVA